MEKKIKELEEKIETLESELNICRVRNSIIEKKYLKDCAAACDCKALKKEISTLQDQLHSCHSEKEIFEKTVKTLSSANTKLQDENRALTARVSELEKQIQTSQSQPIKPTSFKEFVIRLTPKEMKRLVKALGIGDTETIVEILFFERDCPKS